MIFGAWSCLAPPLQQLQHKAASLPSGADEKVIRVYAAQAAWTLQGPFLERSIYKYTTKRPTQAIWAGSGQRHQKQEIPSRKISSHTNSLLQKAAAAAAAAQKQLDKDPFGHILYLYACLLSFSKCDGVQLGILAASAQQPIRTSWMYCHGFMLAFEECKLPQPWADVVHVLQ